MAQLVENLPAMQETWVRSLCWEDPLEKGKATHSSILAWRIPWTVQSVGSKRVGTSLNKLSDWTRDKLGVELALFLTGVISATSLDLEAVFIHQFY